MTVCAATALVRLARGADLHVQCCYLPGRRAHDAAAEELAEHTLACSDTGRQGSPPRRA